jgi:sialate O-acetylesterase
MQVSVGWRIRIWGLIGLAIVALARDRARANVTLPNIFGDHMVMQRGQKNKVWGTADPGEAVTVTIDKQQQQAIAGTDGKWQVQLDPLAAGGPHVLTVIGKNELKFNDVVVGEVWICSGQSNMQWSVNNSNDADLTRLSARYPEDSHDQLSQCRVSRTYLDP